MPADDIPAGRAAVNQALSLQGQIPLYKAQFQRSGAESPADVALIGLEVQIRDQLEEYAGAGVTDLCPLLIRPAGSRYATCPAA